MSRDADWHDPFAEDETARAREQRRAEREARRRGTREALAEKVSDQRGLDEAPPSIVAAPPPTEEEPPAAAPPPSGRPSHRDLIVRRAVAAGAILVLLFVVWFVGDKVRDLIGGIGDDDGPVAAQALKVEDVVLPEGYDRHQIAGVAEDAGLKGDYEQETKKPPKGFPLGEYAPDGAPNLEGFLFPATYEMEKNGKVSDLVEKQLDAFEQNIGGVDMSYAESKNLNVYDVLKIASMIEREVQVPKERPQVAEVIYNRLSAGMPLGIDATIRYEDQNYDQQLLESRLNEDTPYNTRTNTGLPPTPIGNPGLDSIEAAANPAKGKLLYFVVKPGTCGEHAFFESDAEFQRAADEYQRALEEQGGSPTDC